LDGGFWMLTDYQNWRARVYRPVTDALGLPPQPYALGHSFVSVLIQEGRDFREVARLAGHAPEVCARTYAHLFDEWEAIRRARTAPSGAARADTTGSVCSRIVPAKRAPRPSGRRRDHRSGDSKTRRSGAFARWAMVDSNHRPLPYQRSALTD
jgi:hypothetical protein